MNLNIRTCFLIGSGALLAFAAYQLKDFHIGIGERAMGGYDGSATSSDAAFQAAREAKEAAARAEAAADTLKRQD